MLVFAIIGIVTLPSNIAIGAVTVAEPFDRVDDLSLLMLRSAPMYPVDALICLPSSSEHTCFPSLGRVLRSFESLKSHHPLGDILAAIPHSSR